MLENFETNIRKITDNIFSTLGLTFLIGGVGAFGLGNAVFEDWDNEKTPHTETTIQEFQNDIKEITTLQAEQKIQQQRQNIFEHDNASEDLKIRSPEWVDYTAGKAELKQQSDELSFSLQTRVNQFENGMMRSTEIPENTWADLANQFEKATFLDIFPATQNAYVLKECQLESQNTTSNKQVDATKACMEGEDKGDTMTTLIAGFGGVSILAMISLLTLESNAYSIQASARRRREKKDQKKAQKKKMN